MTIFSPSDMAGKRIREERERRRPKMTVKDLADLCAKAGAEHITATVITNLETRRRASREITLDELLTIAAVLEVPPLQLMVPLDGDEQLRVTGSLTLDVLTASAWISDERGFGKARAASGLQPESTERTLRWSGEPLTVVRQIRIAADAIRGNDRAGESRNVIMLGIRLLHLLDHLKHTPPGLDDVMAILARHELPPTLDEWRARFSDEEELGDGEG